MPRTYSQSLMPEVVIWDWHKWHAEERKQYPTQRALARALGVNQSYVAKLGRRFPKGLEHMEVPHVGVTEAIQARQRLGD